MPTERLGPDAEGGFTLIEVLAAMVILAVGLLALEALGIGAARSLARADQQSTFAVAAQARMEERLQEVRRAPAAVSTAQSCGADAASGLYLCSQIETRAQVAALPPRSARVTVQVRRAHSAPDLFQLSSYVFHPSLP